MSMSKVPSEMDRGCGSAILALLSGWKPLPLLEEGVRPVGTDNHAPDSPQSHHVQLPPAEALLPGANFPKLLQGRSVEACRSGFGTIDCFRILNQAIL